MSWWFSPEFKTTTSWWGLFTDGGGILGVVGPAHTTGLGEVRQAQMCAAALMPQMRAKATGGFWDFGIWDLGTLDNHGDRIREIWQAISRRYLVCPGMGIFAHSWVYWHVLACISHQFWVGSVKQMTHDIAICGSLKF